jgi:hypothetical protein
MTILYFDLFTSMLFFSITFYVVKRGIGNKRGIRAVSVHKINQLIHLNYWWFALPYFYMINVVGDLESLFNVKSFALQVFIFLGLLLSQIMFFLKKQPLFLWEYINVLRKILQKVNVKFFTLLPKIHSDAQKEDLLSRKKNTNIKSSEITFLLNSFTFPMLFFIANSYFFTKFIFLLLSFKSTF